MRFLKSPWLVYAIFFMAIEYLVANGFISPNLAPRPSQILQILFQQPEPIWPAFFRTFGLSALAYLLASLIGFCTAVLTHSFPFALRVITPMTSFFQTVPIIAMAPLLVIYLGFGFPSVLAAALIVCFFPVFAATLVGLQQVDANHAELFRFLKAQRWQKLIFLEIPSAVPTILSGLKTAAGLSVVGVVSGEFVAGGGLGGLIDSSRLQQRVDILFTCLFALASIGLTLMLLTTTAFRLIFKRYFAKNESR